MYFRLYNWQKPELAFFPHEELEAELKSKQIINHISEREKKLFYWMPFCGLTNELDESDDVEAPAEETSNQEARETTPESPC